MSLNRCSALRLRINGKLPIHQLQPFLHAGEADTTRFDGLARFKTNPRITKGVHPSRLCRQAKTFFAFTQSLFRQFAADDVYCHAKHALREL